MILFFRLFCESDIMLLVGNGKTIPKDLLLLLILVLNQISLIFTRETNIYNIKFLCIWGRDYSYKPQYTTKN